MVNPFCPINLLYILIRRTYFVLTLVLGHGSYSRVWLLSEQTTLIRLDLQCLSLLCNLWYYHEELSYMAHNLF